MSDDDPFGLKRRYEEMSGESWAALERRVRSNPRHRRLFEILIEDEWDDIERERLRRRPWWKKLLGLSV